MPGAGPAVTTQDASSPLNVCRTSKWRTAWLDALKHDTKLIGMEKREPLCKNKVPREGIVIRKIHDPRAEAFKLKSAAHFHLEMMQHDAGESDMEEES